MTESIKDLPALKPAERAAVVLQSEKAAAELTALAESSKSITAITSADGRTECHAAAMKARAARVAIEKAGKDARDDATAFSKAVIAEEKRLVAIIEPEQDRLLVLRDEWDAKIEAEKAAKIEAERLRVAEIMARIDELRDVPLQAHNKNAAWLSMTMNTLAGWVIDDTFAEFAAEAEGVKRATLAKLSDMHAAAVTAEAEAARLAEEKRIADLLAAQERADREAEASRQREENERIRAENEAAAAKLKADREAFEKQQRQAQEAEDALIASLWSNARRIEFDSVPYIEKAIRTFESGAKDLENDPRPRVAAAVAEARKNMQERLAAAKAAADAEATDKAQQKTDQATVSSNGASSPPEFPAVLSPAEAVAHESATALPPQTATAVAASVTRGEVWSALYDEIDCALTGMSIDELQQVAHFIDRLQSLIKAA